MKLLRVPPLLILGLAFAQSSLHLAAQSSGLPFPADIRLTEVRLPTPNLNVSVRYALVDRGLTYFSPIFVEKAEINGQPLVAADGTFRIPSGVSQLLTLTFRDPEKGPNGRVELRNALAAAPDVLQESGGIPPQPINSALTAADRKVALILRDPFQGNRPVALTGESSLADQEGNPTPKVDFVLDAPTLDLLRRVRTSDIEIAFFQDYPARFETNNVVITVENLQRQVGDLKQSLIPIPDGAPGGGGAAGIVLDAAFGIGLSQSGTLDKSTLVSDFIRRNVSFNVRYRSGASLDTPLVQQLVDFALSRASDFLKKSPFEGTNTFVTLLLSDNIQITTALGNLRKLETQMSKYETNGLFTKLVESLKSSSPINVNQDTSIGFSGITLGSKTKVEVNLTKETYLEQLRQEFHSAFQNAAGWFEGSIPYLPGIRFSTSLGVDNIRWEDFRSALTEFTTGNITLYRAFNLASLANRQSGLSLIDMIDDLVRKNAQFLANINVPRIESGEYLAPTSPFESEQDWSEPDNNGDFWHDVSIKFEKPFEAAPKVVVALSELDQFQNTDVLERMSVRALVLSSTPSQFTLRIRAYNGGSRVGLRKPPKWKLGVNWVATGLGKVTTTQAATSIFTPFRNAMLTQNQIDLTAAEQHFAANLWVSPAVTPDENNRYAVRFSTVPLRTYQVSASADLQTWMPVGSFAAGANDFSSVVPFEPIETYPHLFFRVSSQ